MEHMERIRLLIKQKEKCMYCIMTILCLYLLMKACTNLTYGSAAMYQTFKDYYYYKAVAFFLVVLILIRRVSFLNAPVLATIAVYVIASVKYFIAAAYEVELRNAMLTKCVAWGLFLIILVDMIRTGKRTCFNKQNKIFSLITLFAFSCALGMGFQYSFCLFCPFAAFYLTPISKKQWIWFVDCFTIAYYGAFVWVMTKTLIAVPYSAESFYYFGIFASPWTGGIFCAGAFVCVMYWFLKFWTADKRNMVKVSVCILAMVYPVYITLVFASRSAQLGILGCVLFVFVFAASKPEKNTWKKRGIGVMAVMTVAVICIILLLRFLLNANTDNLPNRMLYTHFKRWVSVARRTFAGDGAFNFFPEGSFLSAIDELSSNRLSILTQTLKNVSFFGSEQLSVLVGETYFHPHNTYATWLMMYGWLGGIPVIIWFFSFLVKSVGGVLKREAAYLFPFLWGAFLVFAMLPDYMPWAYPTAFMLFFAQYPLLIEQTEDDQELLTAADAGTHRGV